MTKKHSIPLLIFCGLSAYIIQSHLSGINPALHSLHAAFPAYPAEMIFLVSTLASLFSIPSCLASGALTRRWGVRRTLFVGISVFLTASILPVVLTRFSAILVTRAVAGLAAGLILPLGPALVSAYFQDLQTRGKLLGWGSTAGNLAGMFLSVGAGHLAAVSVRFFWLVHLIMLVPLMAAVLMPEPELLSEPAEQPLPQGAKLSRHSWVFILLFPLAILFYWPFVLNLSHLVAELGGTSVETGYAFTLSSVGGMLYGLVYGALYKRLGRRLLSVACGSVLVLFVVCALAQQLWLLYLGVFAGSLTLFAVFIDFGITATATPTARVRAVGINMAAANVAIFAGGLLHPWLGSLLGQGDNVRFLFYPGILFFAGGTIWFFVRPPKVGE